MKLGAVLDLLNQNEKSRFVNILTTQILETDEQLTKKTDTQAFVETFNNPKIQEGYTEVIRRAIRDDIRIDIAADIFMADGNGFMSRDSLALEYNKRQEEVCKAQKDILSFINDPNNIADPRVRDYRIFATCLKTAVDNDLEHQAKGQISFDELTVLDTLRHVLGLSDIEARALWMEYSKEAIALPVDDLITLLVTKGIAFYRKASMMIYIPDEFVLILRNLRGLKLPFKYQRRIYNALDERMLNGIIKKYRIPIDKAHSTLSRKGKINLILDQYIDIKQVLTNDIFSEADGAKERKEKLSDIIGNRLKIQLEKQGRNIEERVDYLIDYYRKDELDGFGSLSKDGYKKLIGDLVQCGYEDEIRKAFSLHKEITLDATTLIELLIKPRDILYLLSQEELETFSTTMHFKVIKKDIINSILSTYVDAEDTLVENYPLLAANNILALNEAGVGVPSAEIGVTFERITKLLLTRLGITVNDEIRNEASSEKPDIIMEFPEGILIGECKSSRKKYTKFASVTRQIGSYLKFYKKKGYSVLGSVLFADDFSEDFISDTLLFMDYSLCLVKAEALKQMYDETKDLAVTFPYLALQTRGVLDANLTIKALKK